MVGEEANETGDDSNITPENAPYSSAPASAVRRLATSLGQRPWRIGHCEIVDEIARGGQGVVYQARHRGLRLMVALKVLLNNDPRHVRRFEQEADILGRLRHPNLPKVGELSEYQAHQGHALSAPGSAAEELQPLGSRSQALPGRHGEGPDGAPTVRERVR